MSNNNSHNNNNNGPASHLVQKRLADSLNATFEVALLWLGDQLGLFKDLAENSPTTLDELAARTKLDRRYLQEWVHGMQAAKYLTFDEASKQFTLPAEMIPVLAEERGKLFLGGWLEMSLGALSALPRVKECFIQGGGVQMSEYPSYMWDGMRRFTETKYEHQLLTEWLDKYDHELVKQKLAAGAKVCDIGCGSGSAIIKLAKAFPTSEFIGYDIFQPSIDKATGFAKDAGVSHNLTFKLISNDAKELPDKPFDMIFVFDVVHDSAHPLHLLTCIRSSLKPNGVCLCMDIKCSHNPNENPSFMYGISMCYCMTTSLGQGGEGMGTVGLTEEKMRELSLMAGFKRVRRIDITAPFNVIWELHA